MDVADDRRPVPLKDLQRGSSPEEVSDGGRR